MFCTDKATRAPALDLFERRALKSYAVYLDLTSDPNHEHTHTHTHTLTAGDSGARDRDLVEVTFIQKQRSVYVGTTAFRFAGLFAQNRQGTHSPRCARVFSSVEVCVCVCVCLCV